MFVVDTLLAHTSVMKTNQDYDTVVHHENHEYSRSAGLNKYISQKLKTSFTRQLPTLDHF